jgi:hypothetical protein
VRTHALPIADSSAVWLADLIETSEAVAASEERCDPATVKAFSDRLAMPARDRPLFDLVRASIRW